MVKYFPSNGCGFGRKEHWMLGDERRTLILEELRNKGIVKVNEIAKKFGVTTETARRDIAALQEKKLVRKIYGGAVLADTTIKDSLYSTRETLNAAEKESIGKLAASLINEQDTIILGSGTTILEIAKNIKHFNNLTVITNSLPVISELMHTKIQLFCTGGLVGTLDMNMTGPFTTQALKNFHVDMAFLTALGITPQIGVTCYTPEEALIAKQIRSQASQMILAMDSSKFGHNSLVVQGSVEDYDIIITDSGISDSYRSDFDNEDIEFMIAQM